MFLCLVVFLIAPTSCSRCIHRKSRDSLFRQNIHVGRQSETDLDNLEENSVGALWNTDGHEISLKVGSDFTRFRTLNKRPHQGCSWVDGVLTITQVTSRPETIWPEVWSSMSNCAQKKAKQQWDIDKTQKSGDNTKLGMSLLSSLVPKPLIDQVYLECTQRESKTERNHQNNSQEETSGNEKGPRHLSIDGQRHNW